MQTDLKTDLHYAELERQFRPHLEVVGPNQCGSHLVVKSLDGWSVNVGDAFKMNGNVNDVNPVTQIDTGLSKIYSISKYPAPIHFAFDQLHKGGSVVPFEIGLHPPLIHSGRYKNVSDLPPNGACLYPVMLPIGCWSEEEFDKWADDWLIVKEIQRQWGFDGC